MIWTNSEVITIIILQNPNFPFYRDKNILYYITDIIDKSNRWKVQKVEGKEILSYGN